MWQWMADWFRYFQQQCQRFLVGQSKTEKLLAELKELQMAHFDELKAEVAATRTVAQSAVALIDGLITKLEEHLNEPSDIAAIVSDLKAARIELADAVTRGTVAEGEPEPTPE